MKEKMKNVKRKLRNVMKGIANICKKFYDFIYEAVTDNLNFIANVILLASYPYYVIMNLLQIIYEGRHTMFNVVLCYMHIVIGVILMNRSKKLKNKYGMPIPSKRFTREKNGYVEMEREDMEEMMLYMYDLEEWLGKQK